jgi:hypothetical protein
LLPKILYMKWEQSLLLYNLPTWSKVNLKGKCSWKVNFDQDNQFCWMNYKITLLNTSASYWVEENMSFWNAATCSYVWYTELYWCTFSYFKFYLQALMQTSTLLLKQSYFVSLLFFMIYENLHIILTFIYFLNCRFSCWIKY